MVSKALSLGDLPPGSYQVVVRLKDPASGRITARSAPFRIEAENDEPPPLVISRGGLGSAQWVAAADYERALCWLARGREAEALASLKASRRVATNTAVEGLISRLEQRERGRRVGK